MYWSFWLGSSLGAAVGWICCALIVRQSLELENAHLRKRIVELEGRR